MADFPTTVAADEKGAIRDLPELAAAGRSGHEIHQIDPASLIPLPSGSWLYFLPGRFAIGFSGNALHTCGRNLAVAAFLPPGYVALALSAFKSEKNAPHLPLFCYCAVCWHRNGFYVPALRVDKDPKHDLSSLDMKKVCKEVNRWIRRHPGNRLVAHHGLQCVKKYGCPNAVNLFLRRWEAPISVSGHCNAECHGCISKQDNNSIQAPQARIDFQPTVEEIVEIAVPHLKTAPKAMISFGQGCEGEPLLKSRLIESAIVAIRKETKRGTIHLNTNGSLPDAVKRLAESGLDSIRISLNSARPEFYSAYYQCRAYSFDDVMKSFRIARQAGLWVSINYLTFPGVTDTRAECDALCRLLEETSPQMIQWRNLNIDPDIYMATLERARPPLSLRRWRQSARNATLSSADRAKPLGIVPMMEQIRQKFPEIGFGYFNPPVA